MTIQNEEAREQAETELFTAWFKREYGREPDQLRFADVGKLIAWKARARLDSIPSLEPGKAEK